MDTKEMKIETAGETEGKDGVFTAKTRPWDEEGVQAGEFEAFRQVVAALRSENGCPWDREQTFESLKPCMINEMTEAIAAINIYTEEKDPENLCEELGDVLLQVVLLSQIAQEEGLFQIEDVLRGISRKMIRRHPHVFPDPDSEIMKLVTESGQKENRCSESGQKETERTQSGQVLTAGEVPGRWEAIKQAEKKNRSPQQRQKEKAAFKVAAAEIMCHLEGKING